MRQNVQIEKVDGGFVVSDSSELERHNVPKLAVRTTFSAACDLARRMLSVTPAEDALPEAPSDVVPKSMLTVEAALVDHVAGALTNIRDHLAAEGVLTTATREGIATTLEQVAEIRAGRMTVEAAKAEA